MKTLRTASWPFWQLCILALAGFWFCAPQLTAAAERALLVGCTKYQKATITALNGPRNDVPAMARLLATRFRFPEANVRQLYDWPDDPALRPTYKNIADAFAELARQAQPSDQVVIYMSGHGTQIPLPKGQTDVLDSANPEPDGLDEVFLPADAQAWSEDGVKNAIRDDELGVWLDRIQDRGANVWIVFDCCHSGTMTRGQAPGSAMEVSRTVDPVQALGIPEARYDFLETQRTRSAASLKPDAIDVRQSPAGRGKLVAFYAAQAFEEAPDLPRPAGAPRTPENFFGLLTYTLNQTLQQQKTPLTYRELGRAIVSRYRAERGGRAPTPLFAGDLDQTVLGAEQLAPPSAINLVQKGESLRLDAGELQGVTPGSTLAVLRRAGGAEEALGYVRVLSATPFAAEIEPVAHEGQPKLELAQLPDSSPCKLVTQHVGDMRIKLRIVAAGGDSDTRQTGELVRSVLQQLPAEVQALFELTDKPDLGDYELRVAAPGKVLLVGVPQRDVSGVSPRVYATFSTNDAKLLAADFERDLKKLYTWRNLWRIAGQLGGRIGPATGDIKLEIAAVKGDQDRSGGKLLDQSHVAGGQWLEVRVKNDGVEDYWVSLLFAGADFGIDEWYASAIRRGDSFPPLRSQVDDAAPGPDGFIVLAIPMRAEKDQPRFSILEQGPLGTKDAGLQRAAPPATPFGQLLAAAATGAGTRAAAADLNSASNPTIASWSWVTLPPLQASGRR